MNPDRLECHYRDDIGRRRCGIENTTLFEKYQLCRVLGRGRSGTVYLAKHKELEEYRAIKQVPKSCTDFSRFRQEALILKSLRHPGIPIIYDLEEDDSFSYLIEEFLEGDSIFALVSDAGRFSMAMTLQYGVQICRLVYALHFAKPYPILYLDLQPKNLLLCHNTIKLVDFDHAVHLPEAERLTRRYGTIGYAAPEQYSKAPLDERTDIYAIGAVLYYMATGEYPGEVPSYPKEYISGGMTRVLRVCLNKNKARRYDSVEQLCRALEQILLEQQGVFNITQVSSLTIAVAGAKKGVGTTHIAMGLAAYLMRQGFSALYAEENDSGGVRQFAACTGAVRDSFGIYRIKGIPMLPRYGSAVKLNPHPYPVVVRDYGANLEQWNQDNCDAGILICPGKPWEWEAANSALSSFGNHPRQAVIYNQLCRQMDVRLPGPAKETAMFFMPHDSNPLKATKEGNRLFKAILQHLSDEESGRRLPRLKRLWEKGKNRIMKKRTGRP